MWNDLYKEEPPTYVEITYIRHSFENVLLIWKIIWLYNCGIQEVRAGGSIKEQLKAVLPARAKGCGDTPGGRRGGMSKASFPCLTGEERSSWV